MIGHKRRGAAGRAGRAGARAPPSFSSYSCRVAAHTKMAKRLQYAVVGCGGRGLGYVRLLANNADGAFTDVDLLCLCDAHEPTRATLGKEHCISLEHLHETVDAMLAADGEALDCVVIATPAHLNKICALPCIQRGLHGKSSLVTHLHFSVFTPLCFTDCGASSRGLSRT